MIHELSFLIGCWTGFGTAEFPTIATSRYREELAFSRNDTDPVIHYEQKTWLVAEDGKDIKPIFWESGFLVHKNDSRFEWVSAQKSGRVEILSGHLDKSGSDFRLSLESVHILNDERVLRSGRIFEFSNSGIRYELLMSLKTHSEYRRHLSASLSKNS